MTRTSPASRPAEDARPLSMFQVMKVGAAATVAADPKPLTVRRALPCPFCGGDAPLATKVGPRFVVACMSDDCEAIAQASGSTLTEAYTRWNKRA